MAAALLLVFALASRAEPDPPAGAAQGAPSEAAGAAAAEDPGYTMELWTGLMSPFCPGRLLIDCPSGQAEALRQRIAQEEAAGRSKDEVVAGIHDDYGEIIWQAPRAAGFGWAAYLIPGFAGLVGVLVVWTFLRRQRRAIARAGPRPATAPKRPASLDPEVERRIDAEMNELTS